MEIQATTPPDQAPPRPALRLDDWLKRAIQQAFATARPQRLTP